jgi:Tol biopolymer transport system component
MDMKTGEQKLLFTFAEAAQIPFTGKKESTFTPEAKHWFNHLLFNTDGSRFFFLHRWRNHPKANFNTRAFTIDRDGKNLFCLDPWGATSHFIWRDSRHIMAWAWHPSHGEKFYLYEDLTDKVEVVGPNEMTVNGHNTYLPNTSNQWVLNDTYPDVKRLQNPYLYHLPTSRKVPLGHFHSPPAYTGEVRCDNHPRASRDGKMVCVDSPHNGGRQMYLIDLREMKL